MKLLRIVSTICLFGVSTALAQASQTDLKRAGFSGAVYAVSSAERFYIKDTGEWSEAVLHKTQYYDKDGNITLELEYVRKSVVTRSTFSRSTPGELVTKIESTISPSHTLEPASHSGTSTAGSAAPPPISVHTIRRVFNYGTSGRLESEDAYFDDGSKEETQYDYDSNGRLLKRTSKKDRDSKSITQIMSYDSGPMETGISQYEPCPELGWTSTVSYEFDSHGNWIKRKESTRSIAPAHSPIEVQRLVERTITYYSPETGQGVPIPGETPSDALEPTFDGPPKVIRKSGGALTASATKKVQPKYPASARAAHITGAVVVEITIGEDGNVVKAVALSGPDELRDAAVVAAKAWTFAPTRLSGVPVRVIGIITFNFQM